MIKTIKEIKKEKKRKKTNKQIRTAYLETKLFL